LAQFLGEPEHGTVNGLLPVNESHGRDLVSVLVMARRARAKDARRLWRYMPLNLRSGRVSCTSTSVDEGMTRTVA
jgi:hypothetical protein